MRDQATSRIRSFTAAAPPDNVSLALGEPGWQIPPAATGALADWAVAAQDCRYGPNAGLPELQSALGERYGVGVDQVMVTAGSQAALYAVLTAHLDPGDVVAVPNPGFGAYATLARLAGAVVLPYPLMPDGSLDPQALADALDGGDPARLAMVMLNHPGNPTGAGATRAALERVADICAERDLVLVCDEVYRELWTTSPHPSVREVTDAAVITESVSKAWSAPGLRVGWAIGPPEVLAPARLVHNAMTTAPARPSQVAAAALLRASDAILPIARAELATRWDLVAEHAPTWVAQLERPAGSFYRWAPAPGGDGDAYASDLRDHGGVSVLPGSAFGPAGLGHIRISVGGPIDELVEGLHRMKDHRDRKDLS